MLTRKASTFAALPALALAVLTARAAPFVYVGNAGHVGNPSVSMIDSATSAVVATITVAVAPPTAIAVAADDGRIYVGIGDAIVYFDGPTHAFGGSIPAPGGTGAMILSPDNRRLYATAGDPTVPASVSVIDTRRTALIASIPIDPSPTSLALSSNGSTLIVGHGGFVATETGLTLIDPTTFGIVRREYGLSITKVITATGKSYLEAASDRVVLFPKQQNVFSLAGADQVAVPSRILDIAPSPFSGVVLATAPGLLATVSDVINPSSLAGLPGDPGKVTLAGDGNIFVVHPTGNEVWKLDFLFQSINATIPVGENPGPIAVVNPAPHGLHRGRDLNSDGQSDLVMRKSGTSEFDQFDANSVNPPDGPHLLRNDPNVVLTHSGFFDIDSSADLLWYNTSTGATEMWLKGLPGTFGTDARQVLLTDPNWRVTHVADFNGDGCDDLLWRNGLTGRTAIWLQAGFNTIDVVTLDAPAAWRIVATGDFNGDGVADLVWHNAATGETAIWLMSNGRFAAGAVVLALPDWNVVLVGDFNGDGKSDLVWRNASTGETAIWLMDGTSMVAGAILVASTDWAPTHVGDFDGDGRSDLVWRNSATGETAAWLMNGVAFTGRTLVADPNWSVVEVGDHDGDGRDDLVWRNSVTGYTALWLMNGLLPGGSVNPLTGGYDIQ